jgi:ACR3 family arsenite efflux pump ArsB
MAPATPAPRIILSHPAFQDRPADADLVSGDHQAQDIEAVGAVEVGTGERRPGPLSIPALAFGLTVLTVPSHSTLRLGVLTYLLFPRTDWFLGFIRVTGGNAPLGAALIPHTSSVKSSRALMPNFRNYSLLTFTVSARNAPEMLAITAMASGEQPVLLTAIAVGMLLEFPHLTALTWLLRRRRDREQLKSEIGAGGGGPV